MGYCAEGHPLDLSKDYRLLARNRASPRPARDCSAEEDGRNGWLGRYQKALHEVAIALDRTTELEGFRK